MRLDLLVSTKAGVSRTRAQNIIKTGGVKLDGLVLDKPSIEVDSSTAIEITDTLKFASLGGLKLENALRVCGRSVEGKNCLDLGAANGGFTDCLLRNGAVHVSAVDVTIAFPPELANDSRVTIYNGVNVKDLSRIFEKGTFDFITVDLSFISLRGLFAPLASLLKPDGEVMTLFKPQFEVGRGNLPKSGVLRDTKLYAKTFRSFLDAAAESGLHYLCDTSVPDLFPNKNKERTVFFRL